jgi:hypothetical protein
MTHRNGLKQFYKNKKFKVITQEGSLIDNKSRDLIERSGTAAHYQGRKQNTDYSSMLTSNIQEGLNQPAFMQPLYHNNNQSEIVGPVVSTSVDKEIVEEPEINAKEENILENQEPESPAKDGEIKLVKYIKIVPRKFKENYELRFRDVVRKGNTLKRELYD